MLILEDQKGFRHVLERIAAKCGVPTIGYASGVAALEFLEGCDGLPGTYLVDMRIPGSDEELQSPLAIYRFLESRGMVDQFYFMTAHISEHDKRVIAETSAQIVKKSQTDDLIAIIQSAR